VAMSISTNRKPLIGLVLTVCCLAVEPAVAGAADAAMPNPFFAYCVGIGVGKEAATLPAQKELAPMLADLGYAGMAYVGLNGALEMLETLEKHRQKLLAVYIPLNVDPGDAGYDPKIKEVIPRLAGHGTLVWVVVNGRKTKPSSPEGDARAVELIRQLADAAQPHGVKVSLYPHRGCYAERIEDVVRLAQKSQRPNVGVTFTLCHFMAVDDARNIDRALAMARPYLNMVTINGTDGYDPKNRAGWIRTLDEGSFDVSSVLVSLRKIDFRGPIGMIVYGLKGDRREILARSIKGWRQLSAKAASRP